MAEKNENHFINFVPQKVNHGNQSWSIQCAPNHILYTILLLTRIKYTK